jgi:hypothetical protein
MLKYKLVNSSHTKLFVSSHALSKKFGELIAYFPLIRLWQHRKRRLEKFFLATGTSLPSCYLATIGWYTDKTHYKTQTTQIMTRPTIILLFSVFVAAGTCLSSRCVAPNGGKHLNKQLSCNDRSDTHTDTQTDWRDLFCWDELRCRDIHISFHNDWFMHSTVDRWGSQTRRHRDRIEIALGYFRKAG